MHKLYLWSNDYFWVYVTLFALSSKLIAKLNALLSMKGISAMSFREKFTVIEFLCLQKVPNDKNKDNNETFGGSIKCDIKSSDYTWFSFWTTEFGGWSHKLTSVCPWFRRSFCHFVCLSIYVVFFDLFSKGSEYLHNFSHELKERRGKSFEPDCF